MHLARHRAALRLGAAQGPREFRGLVIVRPDHYLPPQPLPTVDVNDDPGGQLAGEQPGALPQGHRLAERRVLQQQPGGGRDQVEPLGDGLDGPEGQRAARRDRRARRLHIVPGILAAGTRRACRSGGPARRGGPAVGGRDGAARRRACLAGRGDDQAGLIGQGHRLEHQDGFHRAVRAEQRALHAARFAGPQGRRQLRLHRRPGSQVHEGGQQLAGGVPGPGADQVGGAPVGAADGPVPFQQEQRRRGVLEHRAQQPPLSVGGAGLRAVASRPGGIGRHRGGQLDRAIQLVEGRLKQPGQLGSGHRRSLAQRLEPGPELEDLPLKSRVARLTTHGPDPIWKYCPRLPPDAARPVI